MSGVGAKVARSAQPLTLERRGVVELVRRAIACATSARETGSDVALQRRRARVALHLIYRAQRCRRIVVGVVVNAKATRLHRDAQHPAQTILIALLAIRAQRGVGLYRPARLRHLVKVLGVGRAAANFARATRVGQRARQPGSDHAITSRRAGLRVATQRFAIVRGGVKCLELLIATA